MCKVKGHGAEVGDKGTSVASLPHSLLPNSDICKAALSLAASAVPQAILNHCIRTYLFAHWLAEKEKQGLSSRQDDLLFCAAILHDLGASNQYDGPLRFEIEGANAAKALLLSHDANEQEAQQVWTAIALHTSTDIAERIDPFTRLMRLAVLADFVMTTREELGATERGQEVEVLLPRLEIEKVLGDAVVEQALHQPDKAPSASWVGVLLRSHLENPDWKGVNKGFFGPSQQISQ